MKTVLLALVTLCACQNPQVPLVEPAAVQGRITNPGQEFEEFWASMSQETVPATAPKPVATLFGEPIARTGKILNTLIKRYVEREDIYITEAEVEEFVRQMDEWGDGDTDEPMPHSMAEHFVLGFKVDRALYERYGGPVIFQQFNPREPVGAYLALLREREVLGDFVFTDEKAAAKFWDYFERDHGHWVIDPEGLDMSRPWWTLAPHDENEAEDE